MGKGNKARWLRYEHRVRESGDTPTVRSNYVVGAYSKVPPSTPANVQASGGLAQVIFKWDQVDKDAAGKPLQALARYIVYYKRYVGETPIIDIDQPSTYDGTIIVDNNTIGLSAGRLFNPTTNQWEDEYVAMRVAAIDRSGRRSLGSVQVQAKAASSRVSSIIAMGIIEAPSGPGDPAKKVTVVWDNITVVVPSGYRYVVVVAPWKTLSTNFNLQPVDVIFYSDHSFLGLFHKPGPYIKSYLEAGTHFNTTLKIYHYTESLVASYCAEGQTTDIPQVSYDFNDPSILYLGHIEEGNVALPSEFLTLEFTPVIWFVYQVPL